MTLLRHYVKVAGARAATRLGKMPYRPQCSRAALTLRNGEVPEVGQIVDKLLDVREWRANEGREYRPHLCGAEPLVSAALPRQERPTRSFVLADLHPAASSTAPRIASMHALSFTLLPSLAAQT